MNRDEVKECMEQVQIGEEMQQEIIRNLRRRMEGERKRSLKRIAVMAASFVLLVGVLAVSVQAAISNFVNERMENIATEELDGLAEMTRQQELGERVQEAGGISESEASEIARKYMETTPGLSPDGLELFSAKLIDVKNSDWNTEVGIAYGVLFYDSEKCAICLLIVDAVSGSVISVNGEEAAHSESSVETLDMDTNTMEIFRAVLLGDTQFFYSSAGNVEAMSITDVPSLFDAYDSFMKIWEFSVVDLDGDGEEEVVLFVTGAAGDMGGKVILHQIGGEVYGYITDNRTLVDLKTDGTYVYSDQAGLAEAGIAVVTGFSGTEYTVDKLSWAAGTYEGWDTFVVGHQPATEEEYLDAVSRQDKKQAAEWFDFTNENIDTILR